jgi:hypothetical protein
LFKIFTNFAGFVEFVGAVAGADEEGFFGLAGFVGDFNVDGFGGWGGDNFADLVLVYGVEGDADRWRDRFPHLFQRNYSALKYKVNFSNMRPVFARV